MQELEKILEEIGAEHPYKVPGNYDSYSQYNEAWSDAIDRVRARLENFFKEKENDGWIPVEKALPEVSGKCWATVRYNDERLSEPVVVDFRGVPQKFVVDTPNGREYETWGIDSAFHGSRVIAWRPYYIPEPYRPERSNDEKK